MTQHASLKSQLLIAMPNLEDPNFSRTVTYICEHGEHGAMGIVLNRPTELRLSDILQHMKIDADTGPASDQIVFLGDPGDVSVLRRHSDGAVHDDDRNIGSLHRLARAHHRMPFHTEPELPGSAYSCRIDERE